MAKVLVTGASGFIGTHLVAALAAQGDAVTCLVRKTSKADHLQTLGARLLLGDVTDSDSLLTAVAGHQVVYHLAGRTLALKDREFYNVNRRGVAHVAKACAGQETPPVLVYVSSLAAAGPAIDGRPRVESDPTEPVSHYGRSKRGGEHAAESYAHRVPVTVVRPPIVLGEGDRLGLPLFRSAIRFGVHLAPGLKPQRFSLIHADDLVHLLILAAERGKRLPPLGQRGESAGQGYYFAACEQDLI
jgi:dihydroflavonol-4-reductase